MKLESYLHLHPVQGNKTGDSIQTIIAEIISNGIPAQKIVDISIDLDIEEPRTVFV